MSGDAGNVDVEGSEVCEAQMKAFFGEGLHPNADRDRRLRNGPGSAALRGREACKLGRQFNIRNGETELQRALAVAYREHNADVRRAVELADLTASVPDPHHGRPRRIRRRIRPSARRRSRTLRLYSAQNPGPHHGRRRIRHDLLSGEVRLGVWGVAPNEVAAMIEECHDAAVAEAHTLLETHAAFTRSGTNGVAQVDTTGLLGAAFTHRDSRAGDPDLHTHVAISNKVATVDASGVHPLAGPRRPTRAPSSPSPPPSCTTPAWKPPRAAPVVLRFVEGRPRAATNGRSAKSTACQTN